MSQRRGSTAWIVPPQDAHRDINDFYTLGAALGEPGHFGRAVRAKSKSDGSDWAVKIISKSKFAKDEAGLEQLRAEIEIMKKLHHPAIIEFKDAFENRQDLFIVMELCTGGELFDRVSRAGHYSEKDASRTLRQICEAIVHMHKNGIAHCDLKPDNFLLTDASAMADIKVIDFGLSKYIKHRHYYSKFVGTPYYVAPEVLDKHYNQACDLWSLGVVMFVILFGYPPFYADPQKYGGNTADAKIFQLIKAGFDPTVRKGYGAHFPAAFPVSEPARDLITRLLEQDVGKRLTADEALNHPWLRGDAASADALSPLVLDGLRNFDAHRKFEQAVLSTMTNSLTDLEINQLKADFKKLDLDGNGTLTVNELRAATASEDAKDDHALGTLAETTMPSELWRRRS